MLNEGLYALKTAFKKVVHKAAEVTNEIIGKKIADKTVKPKPFSDETSKNIEETILSPEKKRRYI